MGRVLFAFVVVLAAAQPALAGIMIGVTNSGETTSSQDPSETDGFLQFDLTTINTPDVTPTDTPTETPISTYDNIQSEAFEDGFVNADLNYDLTVTINDPTLGELGTVDIGGGGFGGYSPFDEDNPFIDDRLFSVIVNGVTIPPADPFGSDQSHVFSLAIGAAFLNVRLFDPNPDFDRNNPRPGLSLEISQTDSALYDVIPLAPPQVPEPATLLLWTAGASLASVVAAARKRRRTP